MGTQFPMNQQVSEVTMDDGGAIRTLSSWTEFDQAAASLRSDRGYVWRGQKRDEDSGWSLQSSFDRKYKIQDQAERRTKLQHHLETFKKALTDAGLDEQLQDDIEFWAHGQLHGLLTPLLDWSRSPGIAAFFAFIPGTEQEDPSDRYRYVYALDRSLERLLSKQKKGQEVLSVERSVMLVPELPHPSDRSRAQQVVFSKAFQGNDIQNYVEIFSKKRPDKAAVVKFRIPVRDRDDCLRDLRLRGIDHQSLCLNIHDVCDRCNSDLSQP